MVFSYPLSNTTSMVEILQGLNNATQGKMGIAIVVMIFAISYLALLRFENKERFAAAIFLSFLASVFFFAMGLVTFTVVFWTLVLNVGLLVGMWLDKGA